MKIQKIFLSIIVCLAFTTFGQNSAQFKQFNNFSAQFEVPEGKTWVISSIFSNSIGELVTNPDGTTTALPVRIFIKTFNGDIKTDYAGERYGPQVYQSDNTAASVNYPIIIPETTKFSLVIVYGEPGNFKMYNGTAYISYTEMTNNKF